MRLAPRSGPRPTRIDAPRSPGPARTDELLDLIYDELRELARGHLARERRDHTLRPTELVHEVYLKLSRQRKDRWRNRGEFFAVASQTIRRILINHAKARRTGKRGGAWQRVTLSPDESVSRDRSPIDLVALDDALVRLAELDQRQARVVELKFFGGLTNREVADVLGISPRTVDGEWALARSWLGYALGVARDEP